uniref:Glucose-methanol-choline oxidoreductase N-terminal domain-containing protein n=1 Tax=Aureoumbra lagunensis TaxID=44058 RepID=A0A7S3NMR7_9STRA
MRVVEADWIVVGSGPSGCAFAGSMGRLEKSHVIVMLESGGDANSKRVCDFPENLTNRPGFQVLPSGPWKECVVHGRLSYVGGGSAMNAGAFIEDSEYWTSDWNSGCEEDIDRQEDWSTESMHLATKRIVEILGGLECSNDWFSQSFVRAIATQDKTATIISNKMDRLPPFSSNSDNTVIAGAPATCFTRLGDRRQATELLVDSTRLLKNTRVRQIEFDQSGRVGLGVKTENGIFVTARRGIVIAAGPEATALLLFRSGLHKGIGLGFRDHPTVSWPVISFQTPPVNSPSYSGFAFFFNTVVISDT